MRLLGFKERERVGRAVDELWVAGEMVGRELVELSVVGVKVSGMGLPEKRLALC
jgi:hypothetical protein